MAKKLDSKLLSPLYCHPKFKRQKPNEREHKSKKKKQETNHTAATPAKAKSKKKVENFSVGSVHIFLFYEFIMCSFCWKMMNQSKEPSPNREQYRTNTQKKNKYKINEEQNKYSTIPIYIISANGEEEQNVCV